MNSLRPATILLLAFCTLLLFGGLVFSGIAERRGKQAVQLALVQRVVADLALSDLVVTTEARYTRHPAMSDQVAVGMDHPGALDHFPSTLFFAPVR